MGEPETATDIWGDEWRVHISRETPHGEHATEGEAGGAAVKVAVGLSGWTVDVLPPMDREA